MPTKHTWTLDQRRPPNVANPVERKWLTSFERYGTDVIQPESSSQPITEELVTEPWRIEPLPESWARAIERGEIPEV